MRRSGAVASALCVSIPAACVSVADKVDPLAPDIVQEAGLTDAMLDSGDPESAVAYFERAVARDPEDRDLRRGLARAYARAGRLEPARAAYGELVAADVATEDDRLALATIALRLEDWEAAAEATAPLDATPASPRRALIEAMVADRAGDWTTADEAYGRAAFSSETPAEVLNNWGVSRLARGEADAAAATFARAVVEDPDLLVAKNNLAIARAMGGDYRMPNAPLADAERAMLLHNMALVALRRDDRGEARRLFAEALDAHPRHYRAAADHLAELDATAG